MLEASGINSAVRLVADQPRRMLEKKCVFQVKANNSDGVVISIQHMKLRRADAVEDVCLDYVEVSQTRLGPP